MNRYAATARRFPCLLAIETLNPRFHHDDHRTGYSIVLTVNSGYE